MPDRDRSLTAKGERDAVSAGRRLLKKGFVPDSITTSHAVRTTSTARILAQEMKLIERSVLQEPRLYNTDEEQYLDVIREIDDAEDLHLLVGHNFTISQVLYRLVGMRTQEMAPCAVAVLRLDLENWSEVRTGCATLVEFFDPA
jgi:phosphohistidine phosphatase